MSKIVKNTVLRKFEPQIDVNTLQVERANNYANAIDYYRKREQMFIKLLIKRFDENFKRFVQENLSEYLFELYDISFKNYMGIKFADKDDIWKIGAAAYQLEQINTIHESTLEFPAEFLNALIDPNKKNIISYIGALGKLFENIASENVKEFFDSIVGPYCGQQVQNVVTRFIGGEKSTSAVRTNSGAQIGSDIGLFFDTQLSTNNDVLMAGQNGIDMPVEAQAAQVTTSLNDVYFDGIESLVYNQQFINYIAQDPSSGMFGIQVKTWTGGNGKKWITSEKIKNAFGQYAVDPSNLLNRHTTVISYLNEYQTWLISKMIIPIVNPVNIGVLHGNSFEWMSNFLSKHIFMLKILVSDKKESGCRPGSDSGEFLIRQVDSGIYLKALSQDININTSMQLSFGSSYGRKYYNKDEGKMIGRGVVVTKIKSV